jgi:hypothetical protein
MAEYKSNLRITNKLIFGDSLALKKRLLIPDVLKLTREKVNERRIYLKLLVDVVANYDSNVGFNLDG